MRKIRIELRNPVTKDIFLTRTIEVSDLCKTDSDIDKEVAEDVLDYFHVEWEEID